MPPERPVLDDYRPWATLECFEEDHGLPFPFRVISVSSKNSALLKEPDGLYTSSAAVFHWFRDVAKPAIDHFEFALTTVGDDAVKNASAALQLSKQDCPCPEHCIVGTPEFRDTVTGLLYMLAGWRYPVGQRVDLFAVVLQKPPFINRQGGRAFEAAAADIIRGALAGLALPWEINKGGRTTCEQKARRLKTAEVLATQCRWTETADRLRRELSPYEAELARSPTINQSSVWTSFAAWAQNVKPPFEFS